MQCNCESLNCPHGDKACPNGSLPELHVMSLVGPICDDCASHVPTRYMLKLDGRETMRGWRERTFNYSMEQSDRVKRTRERMGKKQ